MRNRAARTTMRGMNLRGALAIIAVATALTGCSDAGSPALFELLRPEATGVTFVNELPEEPAVNIVNYLNFYNGGGVAVGDVDGDGLPDLYFTSNRGPNRLYLNLGDYRFEDISEQAGVAGPGGWTTGATMADVNGDGHLDIYVSTVSYLGLGGRNALYINDGNLGFTDMTETYGLGHTGYATQAAFFDYDLDGDLDAYLLNHSTHQERGNVFEPQRGVYHPRAGDRLLRNDGGRFVDVTEAAGIYGTVEGYGLGVAVSDLDSDGCPDVYVNNDFQENDFLYYNNCDGTFTESIATSVGHNSRSSMGVDAADFNNDGRTDVMVLDMLPEREDIVKTSYNAESFAIEDLKLRAGYHPQYARNVLQLNRGNRRFSEIGYLAGVYATDWSWAPLFVDLDEDGYKDLFVSNGIYRRPNDLDYIAFVRNAAIQASLAEGITEQSLALLNARMPQVPLANYAFRNEGDLTFTNAAAAWGLAQPGFSTGTAYADLNGSGSLDLIMNNINAPASIYRNRGGEITGHHSLSVALQGEGDNTGGIGTKVILRHGDMRQVREHMPTRGFQSSVDHRLHFGLGSALRVDSLVVVWPDRRYQVLTDVAADQLLTLSQRDAAGQYAYPGSTGPSLASADARLFVDVTAETAIAFRHEENRFFDYTTQPLLPHMLSTEGPALAAGDVNGDGLDDVFVGGAKHQPGQLFLQRTDGTFRSSAAAAFRADSLHEDVDAAFLDADGDGQMDLYVVSAGNEFWGEHEALRDRLYMGDGTGGFTRARDRLPDFFQNGSCVVPGDFNGDGHTDLFVGSRVLTREYGRTPRSYLLENDGTGRFRDVTSEKSDGLAEAGMVTSAAWFDHDDDGQLDLVVVGEWMPVRLFRQENGRFTERTTEVGLSETSGWWNRVVVADLTGDGREDLALGNLGLNSYVRASPQEPVRLYVHDFGRNGTLEHILTVHRNGVSYPIAGRDELVGPMPQLRSRYATYADFGASRIEDIFADAELEEAKLHEATFLASAIAVNDGSGGFSLRPLPVEAQFAPIRTMLVDDFDGDGHTDLLIAGNFFDVPPVRGRYDASYGLLLRGDGEGGLQAVDLEASGLLIEGQTRHLGSLRRADGNRLIVAARNDDSPRFLLHRP
ncbi:MAG: VCBS repeat-containing protein [Planctomycetota bacterium]